MSTALVPLDGIHQLADMAVQTLPSPHSRRVYSIALRGYLARGQPLTREAVAAYMSDVRARAGPRMVNLALCACKLLAREAEVRGLMSTDDCRAITSLKCDRELHLHTGNWLELPVVRELMTTRIDRTTIYGKRDAAMFALLLGCGLRRTESTTVTWAQYQEREGRMCLVDVLGKGRQTRTIPVPTWARADLDAWRRACRYDRSRALQARGAILRAFPVVGGQLGKTASLNMSPGTVQMTVKKYLGAEISCHDLRRTLARLMRAADAPLEQIQLILGHSSIATTERYLGTNLKLKPGTAATDLVPFAIPVQSEEDDEKTLEP